MPTKYYYLIINLGAFLIPFIFSFHPKLKFHKQWSSFWPANIIAAVCFVFWDSLYTRLGVWGFNDRYLLGLRFLGLPLEEILFFICIPYSSVFTYHCLNLFRKKNMNLSGRKFSFGLILFLVVSGFIFVFKLYTGITALLLATLIWYLAYIKKVPWLRSFYIMYAVILIPFFIVNGILTGTGLEEPIVWYNNNENLGMRMGTIPIEDIFYGMLLLLLNTFLFERFRNRKIEEKATDIPV